jgi:hypothetical protein
MPVGASKHNTAGHYFQPNDISSLWGWYDYASFAASTSGNWLDKSGNARTATYNGSVVTTSTTGNGASLISNAIYGPNTSNVKWPDGSLPSTYTIFAVDRYAGSNKNRILTGGQRASFGPDWLLGHWNGLTAKAYTNNWLSATTGDPHTTNWAYYSIQNNAIFRSNGTDRRASPFGGSPSNGYGTLLINRRYEDLDNGERSEFMIAEVIIYNKALSLVEVQLVEKYLASKYGI